MTDYNQHEGLFLQKVTCNGHEFDLSFLRSVALIETLDLSGPKLILCIRDPESVIRDDWGVSPGNKLQITFADYWNDPSLSGEVVDKYTIITMPDKSGAIELNCMQSDVWALKAPVVSAQMFTNSSPLTILNRVMPGVKCEVDRFAVGPDYHILPGERRSNMLRQLAIECGAKFYYQRGKAYLKRISAMMASIPSITYEHNNNYAANRIISYSRPNTGEVIKDKLVRSYCGWSMTGGVIKSKNGTEAPAQMSALDSASALDNLSAVHIPDVDWVGNGSGAVRPGIAIAVKWNQDRMDSPLNESLPEKIIVGTASHYYTEQKYLTRVKGILPI